MSKVLFQWVDGGILRQFQLEKNTVPYRILMAVVNEVKQSLEENAAATAQTIPASNDVPGQQADGFSSPPPAASPLPDSVNRSEPSTKTRTPGKKTASTQQWAFCDNCKEKGGKSQHIYGTRFKCAVCDNFDMCEACEASGVHSHHVMLRIGVVVKHVVSWSSRALKPLHNELKNFCAKLTPTPENPSGGNQDNIVCDECHFHLAGDRLKCTVCDDFDLCSACDKKDVHKHHVMMRFSEPVKKVGPWKDMQRSSTLHAQLRAFHNRLIAVKERPTVGRSRSKKAPSKTPTRSRRPQGHKRAACSTAGTPGVTPRKSARTSGSQASGLSAVSKTSNSTGSVASERTSTQRNRGVRSSIVSGLREAQHLRKNKESTDGQTEVNQNADACSPSLKTETSESIDKNAVNQNRS